MYCHDGSFFFVQVVEDLGHAFRYSFCLVLQILNRAHYFCEWCHFRSVSNVQCLISKDDVRFCRLSLQRNTAQLFFALQADVIDNSCLSLYLSSSYYYHEWSSLRVEFHSDNQALVSSLRKGSCRCSNVMSLLRRLFLVCALQNFSVSASYVQGVANGIADSLSCQDFGRFRTLTPQAAAIRTRHALFRASPGSPP